jgi:hypothetical protein
MIGLLVGLLVSQPARFTADCLPKQKDTARRTFDIETLNMSCSEVTMVFLSC